MQKMNLTPSVCTLLSLALSESYYFHGSPTKFDVIKPSHTARRSRNAKGVRVTVYEGDSVHMTPLLYIALAYVSKKLDPPPPPSEKQIPVVMGVSLKKNTNSIEIVRHDRAAAANKSDAIKLLYQEGGYIYAVSRAEFDASRLRQRRDHEG